MNSNNKIRKSKISNSKYKCPICSGKDGIIATFVNGNLKTQLFVYCSECKWEYSKSENIKTSD